MTITGLLLIFAAVLKAHQILTEPVVSKGFWESWLFFVIQVPLELGLGIWLVSGLFRKAGWLLTVIAFAGFIVVTAYKAYTGQASCGCFGRVTVDPLITLFTMDVPVFFLLLIFRPKGEKLFPPPWPNPVHFVAVAIPTALILGVLIPTLAFNKPPDRTEKHIVIKPNNWKIEPNTISPLPEETNEPNLPGKPAEPNEADLPDWQLMLKHTDIVEQLTNDVRIILFYHYDCPDCAVAIPLYSQYSGQYAADEQIQFAFVKGPPYGADEEDPLPDDTTAIVGKLDLSRDWIFESPLTILLIDGQLKGVWQVEFPDMQQLLETILTAQ